MLREVSPHKAMTAEQFLEHCSASTKDKVASIRAQKESGTRPLPTTTLLDQSRVLSKRKRDLILDKVALLVDENLFGRTEMCTQFADLLSRALTQLGIQCNKVMGTAIYYSNQVEFFRWEHAWVRIKDEIVDGNVDVLNENPLFPQVSRILPYWGPVRCVPVDRMLRQDHSARFPLDDDVEKVWWPELLHFIQGEPLFASANID